MTSQFRQSTTPPTVGVPQPSDQQALPPGWTVRTENSETSRKLIQWFADRGLEAHVAMAEGPAGRPLAPEEFKVIEEAAHRLSGFDDNPTPPGNYVLPNWDVLDYDGLRNAPSRFNDKAEVDLYSAPGQALRQGMPAPIQYGPTAQEASTAPAGKPDDPADKKALAAADWEKRRPQVLEALDEVFAEVKRSMDKHGGFRSGHEGYAVLLEEVDELWDEIKADNSGGNDARNEAMQVAAMAVKYMVYIAGNNR